MRGRRRGMHRLSARFVQTAPPGMHCDGAGLYLRVDPSGARRWVQQITVRGRPRSLGLGGVRLVSLAEARAAALANQKLARAGGDPLAERRRARSVPTVEEAAARVLEQRRTGWRSAKHAQEWVAKLRLHAFPRIGTMPISDVTTAHVLEVLSPIWHTKHETARRVRQQLGAIVKWALALGLRPGNPVEPVGQAIGPQRNVVRHMRALPYADVPAALAAVRESRATLATRLAFEFLVLTAARSGEVRLATWTEMDLDAAVWTVPPERMKANRAHQVPLSRRTLAVLRKAQKITRVLGDCHGLVFPSARRRPLSDSTVSKLVKGLGIPAVPHGFRSSFRDWAAERSDARQDVIEAALAHTVRDKTVAASARSSLLKRRRLMDAWAAYLTGSERGRVVQLRPGAGASAGD